MSENFERFGSKSETEQATLRLQELRVETEKLEKPSEQLRYLIRSFDRAAFPDSPLSVLIEDNPENPWEENHTAALVTDDKSGEEYINPRYAINPTFDTKEPDKEQFERFLRVAIHEVRHRAQHEYGVRKISNIDELSSLITSHPSLHKYQGKIMETVNAWPGHVKSSSGEFDAKMTELFGPAMMNKGASVQEIANEIIKANAEEMLGNTSKRL